MKTGINNPLSLAACARCLTIIAAFCVCQISFAAGELVKGPTGVQLAGSDRGTSTGTLPGLNTSLPFFTIIGGANSGADNRYINYDATHSQGPSLGTLTGGGQWASDVNGNAIPPSVATRGGYWSWASGAAIGNPSPDARMGQIGNNGQTNCDNSIATHICHVTYTNGGNTAQIQNAAGTTTFDTGNLSTGCPTGYTDNGSACNLTNAAQAWEPSDGVCKISRVGNSFSNDTHDPDCGTTGTTGPVSSSNANTPGNVLNNTGATVSSASGNDSVTATLNASTGAGTITIKHANPDGTTTTTTISTTGGGTGQGPTTVGGTSTQTTLGSGTNATSTVAGQTIDVSGLDKEATQGQVLSTLQQIRDNNKPCGGTGQPKCVIDEADTATRGDSAKAKGDDALSKYDAKIAKLNTGDASDFSISVFNPGATTQTAPDGIFPTIGSCVDPTFSLGSASSTLKICEFVGPLRSIAEWMLYALGAISIWFVFRGKNENSGAA